MSESSLQSQVAVVTGASSGIGRAIALHLARQGATLCLLGRKVESLEEVAKRAQTTASQVYIYPADLALDETIRRLATNLRQDVGRIDILVHSAGMIAMGEMGRASVDDFDRQYQTNVRAPYGLTQILLPFLLSSRGQIAFINSSAIHTARSSTGQFAATQHALKAIADSLREEVNAFGVRVLSVFPGRTATPRQAIIHEWEGKPYYPELLLQPEDVAAVVVNALELPRTAEVTDIHIRPMKKS